MKFSHIARKCANLLGSAKSFVIATALILLWLFSGPVFQFSTTWQLLVNTTTTVITFLAVFLIQNQQNADMHALHLKLDEIILSLAEARNEYMEVEKAEDTVVHDLEELHHQGVDKGGK